MRNKIRVQKNMAVVEEQERICENFNVGETGTVDPGGNVDELLVEEVRKHRILWDTLLGATKTRSKRIWLGLIFHPAYHKIVCTYLVCFGL